VRKTAVVVTILLAAVVPIVALRVAPDALAVAEITSSDPEPPVENERDVLGSPCPEDINDLPEGVSCVGEPPKMLHDDCWMEEPDGSLVPCGETAWDKEHEATEPPEDCWVHTWPSSFKERCDPDNPPPVGTDDKCADDPADTSRPWCEF
jgi:hypothetical protein